MICVVTDTQKLDELRYALAATLDTITDNSNNRSFEVITEEWNSFATSFLETVPSVFGTSHPKKYQDWFDENSHQIRELIILMNVAHKAAIDNPSCRFPLEEFFLRRSFVPSSSSTNGERLVAEESCSEIQGFDVTHCTHYLSDTFDAVGL